MPDIPQTTTDRVSSSPTIDTCTHVLPPVFGIERERISRTDATFRSLFANPKAKIVQTEDLLASMDQAGIDVSVCAGFGWTDPGIARESNDYNLEAARSHPDRLVAFCSVNPLWGDDAAAEVRRCHEAGAKGIGELHPDTQGILDADMASLAPVFDAAKELKIPILMHASEPVGHGYPGKGTVTPELLMALVNAFPNNTFIFSHFGGGLPFYGLMPEVKLALKNVYFDSAAFPFLYRPEVFDVAARAVGAEKILFASDFPVVTQRRALKEFELAGLSPEQSRLVRGANAAQLLDL
ncbi:MAG: amidohydrolase [Chloroflexi bacterium]|nr:amidohydrolase [Chloroflexota bacterium]MCI0870959.1 amidohydrolase [Chloroflexota bacterium]